jgi:hypothetical protein
LRSSLGKLPGFQNTTMNAPEREFETKARYPKITRGRSGRRTRPVPHQKY